MSEVRVFQLIRAVNGTYRITRGGWTTRGWTTHELCSYETELALGFGLNFGGTVSIKLGIEKLPINRWRERGFWIQLNPVHVDWIRFSRVMIPEFEEFADQAIYIDSFPISLWTRFFPSIDLPNSVPAKYQIHAEMLEPEKVELDT